MGAVGRLGRVAVVISVVPVLVAVVACTSDDPAVSTTASVPHTPTSTSVVTTTSTVPSSTTSSTTSTVASSTSAVATTSTVPSSMPTSSSTSPPVTAPADGGWVRAELPAWSSEPCCAEVWPIDGSSPPLPAPGDALADGIYHTSVPELGWWPWFPERLRLRIARFEECGTTPGMDVFCESDDPTEIGVVRNEAIEIEIALDADLTVGFTGAACAPGGGPARSGWVGDGVALAALWSEADAAFEEWVRPRMDAGIDSVRVMDDLDAGDTPFDGHACDAGVAHGDVMNLMWTSPAGPSLLFQSLDHDGGDRPLEAWELMYVPTIEIRDGQMTLYVERAYRS